MNTKIQKWGPPAAVIGIALYLGWPPSEPLDLGEDIVRAKAVRWKATDLDAPSRPPKSERDPFGLIVDTTSSLSPGHQPTEMDDAIEPSNAAPSDDAIRSGISVDGIARTNAHQWVILNGKVCRIGDQIAVKGFENLTAIVTAIQSDSVWVDANDRAINVHTQSRDQSIASHPKSIHSTKNLHDRSDAIRPNDVLHDDNQEEDKDVQGARS